MEGLWCKASQMVVEANGRVWLDLPSKRQQYQLGAMSTARKATGGMRSDKIHT